MPHAFTPWPDEYARRYRQQGFWSDITLNELLHQSAAKEPDRVSLVQGDRRLSYGDLVRAIDRLALRLAASGLEPEDPVVFQLPNCIAFVVALFALLRIGAIPILALPAHRREEVANGRLLSEIINDEAWYRETLIPTVAQRGTAIIEARGSSSAASAANAAIGHMRDWILGSNDRWVSMGIPSYGSYGIPDGIVCGAPVICADGKYQRVADLPMSAFARAMIERSCAELSDELASATA